MRGGARRYAYVIVGGGSAGCVLAARLSERGHRVLLVEAGPHDRSPFIHIPAGLLRAGRFVHTTTDEPDPSRNGQTMSWNAGRVLGGGSSINGMVWTRGHRADFDGWEALGCPGWGYDDVLPYFKRCERWEGGADDYRGGDGPLHVGMGRVSHPLTDAFVAAARQAGYEFSEDNNGERLGGISYTQTNQWRGFRHSTARAYLGVPARKRRLEIVTGASVQRVRIERGRATGVELIVGGRLHVAEASAEVIVCAGVLGSPKLLMLSGIGPGDHLRSLGIPVVADNGRVGHNLQEHPVAMMVWNVDVPTLNVELTLKGFVRHGVDFALHGRGPAAVAFGHAFLFSQPDAVTGQPDAKALFAPLGLVGADAGDTSKETIERVGDHDVARMQLLSRPSVMATVSATHPRSRGQVRLRAGDPHAPLGIRMALLGERRDLDVLIAGCRDVREVFRQSPMAEHVLGEALPGPGVETDAEWEGYARSSSFGGQHAVGTCTMGSGDDAVVDPELRVRGVDGLRVVDASVIPRLPSGHTNAPTVMIAERAADLVTEAAR